MGEREEKKEMEKCKKEEGKRRRSVVMARGLESCVVKKERETLGFYFFCLQSCTNLTGCLIFQIQ